MKKPLEKEYEFYKEIRGELARAHAGKLVAIKDRQVLGIFENYRKAADAVYVDYEYGTVLMQELGRDQEYFAGYFPAPVPFEQR